MKKLTLLALAIMPSLISSLNPSQASAQLSLTCPTQGSLALSGKLDFLTTTPAQCTFTVDNSVPTIAVTVSLGTPILTFVGSSSPPVTTNTAQLTYSNSGSKTLDEGTSIGDTFSGNTVTNMLLNMQSQKSTEFFAGTYTYTITVDITAP